MRKAIVLGLGLALAGCTTFEVSRSKAAMAAKLDPLLGRTKKEVILQLGAPVTKERVEDIDIYHYRQTFGERSDVGVYAPRYAQGRRWEAYDEFNVYFQEGVMVKWDGYVQR